MSKKSGLGRGIDALIQQVAPPAAIGEAATEPSDNVIEIDIDKLEPNRSQPRRNFDANDLAELAESVRTFGILQPIMVKRDGAYYTIIAGERRWRAARLARLSKVPIIIREFDDKETLEVALIENLQRSDLNPMEEAVSYKRLADEYGMTQERIAERLGKSRSAVANAVRLLNLPEIIREMLIQGRLSGGHAKVLLGIEDEATQIDLADMASDGGMSVRELEDAVKARKDAAQTQQVPAKTKKPGLYPSLEQELTTLFHAKTRIKTDKNGEKGKIEIDFASKEELDRLYLALKS
ncbi:MAG: ParB/RepB/Spo0J family partition protein [Defluviitaleaceae bacterium]|nr:ParB/RepB/Spo0J family partition protein [Defluviitaleaceae bacterium]